VERVALDGLNADTFAGLIGTGCRVSAAGAGSVPAELTQVQRYDAQPGGESFALLFRLPVAAFEQGTYEVEHEAIGAFDLFLVPVGATAEGILAEAVFNRVASA
jgi:hypothetical protein